ncbi:Pentatricopeptide repeat-containing protein [Rhynchospora pubera]|uniref:Pentatricopeptide repeat-containing protein n=1 Tax=Rhynchospora pubera TaxID=906938 RepID=A0AAV8DJ85_9POAL|nr:Pentatricopeptide repeat-containing protein [Rhynchospora pubera]
MINANLLYNSRLLVRLIKSVSSSSPSAHLQAQTLHSFLTKSGFLFSSDFISSSLISLYSSLNNVSDASQLFDELPQPGLVSCTALAKAYVTLNQPNRALSLFARIRSLGLFLDSVALATALSACNQLRFDSRNPARTIHGFIISSGIKHDVFVSTELIRIYGELKDLDIARHVFDSMDAKNIVSWNAIIHQYVRNGQIGTAHELFEEMPSRDLISWNTLVSGYCQMGLCGEALALIHKMVLSKLRPNEITLCTVFQACTGSGAFKIGKSVHAFIEKNNLNSNGVLDHCLIDMYSKCGSIEKAVQIFNKEPNRRDLYSWTSIICGLTMHGFAKDAILMFHAMQRTGVWPDDVTLVGVLNACAHGELIDEGFSIFNSIETVYSISPKIEHYGCVVDLLGCVGRLKEAYEFVLNIPMKPNLVIWGTLLSACKMHKNVEIGEIASMKMIELDPSDAWPRVMLSSIYAEALDWSGLSGQWKELKDSGTRKTPGYSLV